MEHGAGTDRVAGESIRSALRSVAAAEGGKKNGKWMDGWIRRLQTRIWPGQTKVPKAWLAIQRRGRCSQT
jgi:hypothetical protein